MSIEVKDLLSIIPEDDLIDGIIKHLGKEKLACHVPEDVYVKASYTDIDLLLVEINNHFEDKLEEFMREKHGGPWLRIPRRGQQEPGHGVHRQETPKDRPRR